jgi:uncharacterized paraquat-inducible protein A
MKCNHCGKLCFDSDTHCPDCGAAVGRRQNPVLTGVLFIAVAVVLLFLLIRKNF